MSSFTLDGISGGNAVFNTEKLDWMNGIIGRLPIAVLAGSCGPACGRGLGSGPLVVAPALLSNACSSCCAHARSV